MYRLVILVVMGFVALYVLFLNIREPLQKMPSVIPTLVSLPTATLSPTPYIFKESRLFDLVQRWRVENNLQPYIKSDFLCTIADTRLQETEKEWNHSRFIGSRFCTSDCYLGENLSRFFKTEQETMDGWLESPSHLENLKKDYSHTCLKCDTSSKSNYCVQIFGYY